MRTVKDILGDGNHYKVGDISLSDYNILDKTKKSISLRLENEKKAKEQEALRAQFEKDKLEFNSNIDTYKKNNLGALSEYYMGIDDIDNNTSTYRSKQNLYGDSDATTADKWGLAALPEDNFYTNPSKYAINTDKTKNNSLPQLKTFQNSYMGIDGKPTTNNNNNITDDKFTIAKTSPDIIIDNYKKEEKTTVNVMEEYIKDLNIALAEDNIGEANNLITKINKNVFGEAIYDGIAKNLFGVQDSAGILRERFIDNNSKLEVINNSIKNTSDEFTLNNLRGMKDKLEFENLLINYNAILFNESMNRTIDRIDSTQVLADNAIENFKNIEVTDFKSGANKVIQGLSAIGTVVTSGLDGILAMSTNTMDDGAAKTIIDTGLNIGSNFIPGVASARVVASGTQFAGTASSMITGENSVLHGEKANGLETLGSAVYFGANFLSAKTIKNTKDMFTPSTMKNIFTTQGREIAKNIGYNAASEGIAEFAQVYGETVMYGEDLTTDTFKNALIAGAIGAAVAGGVSTIGGLKVNNEYNTDTNIYRFASAKDTLEIINGDSKNVSANVSNTNNSKTHILNNINNNSDQTIIIMAPNQNTDSQFFSYNQYTKEGFQFDHNKPAYQNMEYSLEDSKAINSDLLSRVASANYNGNTDYLTEGNKYTEVELSTLQIADDIITDASTFSDDINLMDAMTSLIYEINSIDDISNLDLSKYPYEVANYFMDGEIADLKAGLEILKSKPRSDFAEAKIAYTGSPNDTVMIISKNQEVVQAARAKGISVYDLTDINNTQESLNTILDEVLTQNKYGMKINNEPDKRANVRLTNKQKTEFINKFKDFIKSSTGKTNNIYDNIEYSNMINTAVARHISSTTNDLDYKTRTEIATKAADLVDDFIKSLDSTDYVRNNRKEIIIFDKISSNEYNITNPKSKTDNIKGIVKAANYISTNIKKPINLSKQQVSDMNKLLDMVGSKDVARLEMSGADLFSLVNKNKSISRNLLQIADIDGLLHGNRLITAHNDYDNIDSYKHLIEENKILDNNLNEYFKNKDYTVDVKNNYNTIPTKSKNITTDTSYSNSSNNKSKKSIKNNSMFLEQVSLEEIKKNIGFKDLDNDVLSDKVLDEYISSDVSKAIEELNISDAKIKKPITESTDKIQAAFFDDKAPIRLRATALNDVDIINDLNNIDNINNMVYNNLRYAQSDLDGNIIGDSFDKIISPLQNKTERKQWDIYMRLKYNAERIKKGAPAVINNISEYDSNIQAEKILKKYPHFDIVAKNFKQYTTNNLDLLLDAGLISDVEHKTLVDTYQYYIPIFSTEIKSKNVTDSFGNANFEMSKHGTSLKDASKASKQTVSVYKSVEISEFQRANSILKNRLVKDLVGKKEYSGKDGTIQYFDNGQIKELKTTKDVALAVKGPQYSVLNFVENMPILNLLPKAKRMKSKLLTQYSITFQLANPIRDLQDSAFLFSEYKNVFVKNYARAVANSAKNTPLWNEFKSLGLTKNYEGKNKYLSLINTTEAMPKFAEWISARDAGVDPKIAKAQAAVANINMNRGGRLSKDLDASGIPFLNAAMLGAHKVSSSSLKLIKNANTPKGALQALVSVGVMTGPAIFNALTLEDNDEYNKLPSYMKNNYYFIPIDDSNNFLRIPKGRATALYDTIVRYTTGISEENTIGEYATGIWDQAKAAAFPLDIIESSVISEISNLAKNEDNFGNKIYSTTNSGDAIVDLAHYALNNWGSVYGRIVSDLTDDDHMSDIWTSSTFIFDSTKYDKNKQTVFNLVEKYRDESNINDDNDVIIKKYLDTQYYRINSIQSEINDYDDMEGNFQDELRILYQELSMLTNDTIKNYKNYTTTDISDGNKIIYFDDLIFEYNSEKDSYSNITDKPYSKEEKTEVKTFDINKNPYKFNIYDMNE